MSVFARFVAFEAIGWAVAFVVAYGAVQYELVGATLAWTLFALFVAKDFVLFPLTKRAYEQGPTHGAAELLGSRVQVLEAIEPGREGYVLAGTERWRARLTAGCEAGLEAGQGAQVRAIDGIMLVVEPAGAGGDER